MHAARPWPPLIVITAANLLILGALFAGSVTGWPFWAVLAAVALGQSSLYVWSPKRFALGQAVDLAVAEAREKLQQEHQQLRERQEEFDELRGRSTELLHEQTRRLQERERNLAERLAQFHEVLEYPLPHAVQDRTSDELVRLSEFDREVTRILEAEAECVYEKIRANGYMAEGRVDVAQIRDEIHQLVLKIARVYSPGSTNPLLETSFEQLARAASRVCLHTLVLLEQLPMNVQQYNFNSLYSYLRTAIQGYGAYKKAAPWLTYLSRGMYAGRVLSASNPLTMGAWWLASEVGKKGAQKYVENLVDRQAVAVLHDLVTVVGVEIACIYGTGFRHRDPAWVLGTELVELISQFPLSRESLREGLRQVTALPLRNEYDRIYLYRCLANHRSGGLRLPDSAMLTRSERETIAARIEAFFSSHIHGTLPAQVSKWRDGFEERFDLRLKLSGDRTATSQLEQVCSGIISLTAFLNSVAGLPKEDAIEFVKTGRLPALLTERERGEFLAQLSAMVQDRRFEPPNLEPSSPVTDAFLSDMAMSIVRLTSVRMLTADEQLETLAIETGAYFRRSVGDMRILVDKQWILAVKELSDDGAIHSDLTAAVAREILAQRTINERLSFCYSDISLRMTNDHSEPLPDAWMIGFTDPCNSGRRALLLRPQSEHRAVWWCNAPLIISRERGMMIDSAAISGGNWLVPVINPDPAAVAPAAAAIAKTASAFTPAAAIVVSGSLRGGRFKSYFRPLLQFSEQPLDA